MKLKMTAAERKAAKTRSLKKVARKIKSEKPTRKVRLTNRITKLEARIKSAEAKNVLRRERIKTLKTKLAAIGKK